MTNRAGFILIMASLMLLGCAHAVSKELREAAKPPIPVAELFKDPDAHKGRTVILGGLIISSKNTAEGSYLEVLERPLDSTGRPADTDISRGRFIVFSDGYLDAAIYSQGRRVTAAAEVVGKEVRAIDGMDYPYLRLKAKEIYLFKPSAPARLFFGIGIRQSL